jgi:hypothetical protein
MSTRRSQVFALLFALLSSVLTAAPAPAPVRSEIESLLKALQESGCQFNRNGAWFTGSQAQAHLTKKLEHLEGKSLVKSAEDFITLGASTSSSSGKPYMVRCGHASAIESKVWLHDRLKALRQAK